MKRLSFLLLVGVFTVLLAMQSCAVKKDCRGNTKHRLANGIWI